MKIKEMPKQNRPRERFLKYGPKDLGIDVKKYQKSGNRRFYNNFWIKKRD